LSCLNEPGLTAINVNIVTILINIAIHELLCFGKCVHVVHKSVHVTCSEINHTLYLGHVFVTKIAQDWVKSQIVFLMTA